LAADSQQLAQSLETAMVDLTAVHGELFELVLEHRRAISLGDAAAIQECLSRQGILGMRIADLERARRQAVSQICGRSDATISDVTAKLPEHLRAAVSTAAARLKAILTLIQRENNVVRAATHTLIAHIDGLMQQVARALSHAGTYGRKGRIEASAGGPIPCGLDMTH